MAGRVKRLIDELIQLRAQGSPGLEHFVRAHLVLNGINPEDYNDTTEDEPEKEKVLQEMIRTFQWKNAPEGKP